VLLAVILVVGPKTRKKQPQVFSVKSDAYSSRIFRVAFDIYPPSYRKMDSLPPNDPNNNRPNGVSKEQPYSGHASNGGANRRSQRQRDGETMDVIGNLEDSPVVVAMFLVGIATWLLRERCVC